MGIFQKIADVFTSTARPAEGTPVKALSELKEGLTKLNRSSAPFRIVSGAQDKVDLIAEWKINEPDWKTVFGATGKTFRILMKLDEANHEVRAVDRELTVNWEKGFAEVSVSVQAFRGQKSEISIGGPPAYVETTPEGKKIEYRLTSNELKKPLKEVTISLGWTYKGVTFSKL